MTGDETVKAVQGAASAMGEVVKLAKESPDAREAGQYAAKSLRIVMQTVNTVLLPLAAANYGAARFADYMVKRFGPELQEVAGDIPEERIQPPRATIAGPVLDALVYAHEDASARRLYLSLLATAMDSESRAEHPAFVDILRQLDGREIPFLRAVLAGASQTAETLWPVAQVGINMEAGLGTRAVFKHVLDWRAIEPPADAEAVYAYVENWARLGLVETDYIHFLTKRGAYDWVRNRPEYSTAEAIVENWSDDGQVRSVNVERGVLRVTDWGAMFARAVRIDEVPADTALRELADWRTGDLESPAP